MRAQTLLLHLFSDLSESCCRTQNYASSAKLNSGESWVDNWIVKFPFASNLYLLSCSWLSKISELSRWFLAFLSLVSSFSKQIKKRNACTLNPTLNPWVCYTTKPSAGEERELQVPKFEANKNHLSVPLSYRRDLFWVVEDHTAPPPQTGAQLRPLWNCKNNLHTKNHVKFIKSCRQCLFLIQSLSFSLFKVIILTLNCWS